MLDNGAFSAWKNGAKPQWSKYYEWCARWLEYHTTWAVIPDVIDGGVEVNDALLDQWPHGDRGAPVWHLHEPLDRLRTLCVLWPRVCFGSSGGYATVGTDHWHRRVSEAFDAIAPRGVVPVWVHMMRGLQFSGSHYPFASADSTNVALHSHELGAENIARSVDVQQCPARWCGATQQRLEMKCID